MRTAQLVQGAVRDKRLYIAQCGCIWSSFAPLNLRFSKGFQIVTLFSPSDMLSFGSAVAAKSRAGGPCPTLPASAHATPTLTPLHTDTHTAPTQSHIQPSSHFSVSVSRCHHSSRASSHTHFRPNTHSFPLCILVAHSANHVPPTRQFGVPTGVVASSTKPASPARTNQSALEHSQSTDGRGVMTWRPI